MKNILFGIAATFITAVNAQVETPQLSPLSKLEQQVGLTSISVEYSRPSKRDRVIFGNIVPMNEIWRTGANKNSMVSVSDNIVFGKDTLAAGTYSLFSKPTANDWTIYFYKTTDNWGTPDEWLESNVALAVTAPMTKMTSPKETFTIEIENISTQGAHLVLLWDNMSARYAFSVPTEQKVLASIDRVMAGPSANDYYRSADYYFNEKKDLNQALTWINKAIELNGNAPFWMLRKKALIQSEMGDKKGAIATAKLSMEAAKVAGNDNYVKMNEASITEWSKK